LLGPTPRPELRLKLSGANLELIERGILFGQVVAKHELTQPLHRPVRFRGLRIDRSRLERLLDAPNLSLQHLDGAMELIEFFTALIPSEEVTHRYASDSRVRGRSPYEYASGEANGRRE
jgi:hypothetical protein